VAGDGNDVAAVVLSLPILDELTGRVVNLYYCSLETLRVGRLEIVNEFCDLIGLSRPNGLVDE
jgi:hypothetical protein